MRRTLLAIVGEAWGAEEEAEFKLTGKPAPFVGEAGRILNAVLNRADIARSECFVTNLLNLKPPDTQHAKNDFWALMVPKREGVPGLPPVRRSLQGGKGGKYFPPNLLPELQRLHSELIVAKPRAIVTLGGPATWALVRDGSIMERRGHYHTWRNVPLIPSVHPAYVLRQYQWFTLLALDLAKAAAVAQGERAPDSLSYEPAPRLTQLAAFISDPGPISCDVETRPKFRGLTCIGLASPRRAICCPFAALNGKRHRNYWGSVADEMKALSIMTQVLENKETIKVFHNGIYDMVWLREIFGIEVAGEIVDTLIEHRALYPELPHKLGQVTANYALFPPWKAEHASSKREE